MTPHARLTLAKLTALCVSMGGTYAACSDGGTKTEAPRSSVATRTDTGTAAATGKELAVSWDKASGSVDQFKIYVAKSATDDDELLESVDPAADGFDASHPAAVIDSTQNDVLKAYLGKSACVTVKAVAGGVESNASNQVCVDL